jgi:hypothetical protein
MTEIPAEYRRRMLEETNRAYAALQGTPEEWAAEVSEREAWDTACASSWAYDNRSAPRDC